MIGQNRGRGTETETETLLVISHNYGVEISVHMKETSGRQASMHICSLLREYEKRWRGYPGCEREMCIQGCEFHNGMNAANSQKCRYC